MTTRGLYFELIEGKWHDATITVKDTTNDPNPATAPAVDITDLVVELYLKPTPSDPDPTPLSSTDTTQIEKSDPTNGKARVHFTNEESAKPAVKHFWRLDVTSTSGEVQAVMMGEYSVINA